MTNNIKIVKVENKATGKYAVLEGYGIVLKMKNLGNDISPAVVVYSKSTVGPDIVSSAFQAEDRYISDVFYFPLGIAANEIDEAKIRLDDSAAFCSEFRRRREEFFALIDYKPEVKD